MKLIYFINLIYFRMYKTASRGILSPAEICDLLKGSILIICTGIILYIDTSMMYHLIKSQSVIKLYIFFNMLEVNTILYKTILFNVFFFLIKGLIIRKGF